MRHLLKLVFFAFLLTACAPHHPTVAERRAQQRAEDSVQCLAQERSMVYWDSLLQVTQPRVDALLPAFVYEKNKQYEDRGRYVHRLLQTSLNRQRNFLQVCVADDGELQVRSYYVGEYHLNHASVRLTADSVSVTVPGTLHAFDVEERHEIVTVQGEDAWQLLRFVDGYSASRTRVTLEGKKRNQAYYLSDKDKQALVDSYRLAMLIRDIQQLESQLRYASLQVEKYKKRAEKVQ